MKKIFILIDQLHSHGGIEKLVVEKANYWSDFFGYKIKIISTEQSNKPFVYELSDKVNLYADDGCHPNEKGSQIAAEIIAEVLMN